MTLHEPAVTIRTSTAPCDDCGQPVRVPDPWPVDWARCQTCATEHECDPYPNPPVPTQILAGNRRLDAARAAGIQPTYVILGVEP